MGVWFCSNTDILGRVPDYERYQCAIVVRYEHSLSFWISLIESLVISVYPQPRLDLQSQQSPMLSRLLCCRIVRQDVQVCQ